MGADIIAWQTLVMGICGSVIVMVAVVVMIKYILGGGSSGSEMQAW